MSKISKCDRDRLVDYFRTQSVCDCDHCRWLRDVDVYLPEGQWSEVSRGILNNLRAYWQNQEDG